MMNVDLIQLDRLGIDSLPTVVGIDEVILKFWIPIVVGMNVGVFWLTIRGNEKP